jgi:hypothetical protein
MRSCDVARTLRRSAAAQQARVRLGVGGAPRVLTLALVDLAFLAAFWAAWLRAATASLACFHAASPRGELPDFPSDPSVTANRLAASFLDGDHWRVQEA